MVISCDSLSGRKGSSSFILVFLFRMTTALSRESWGLSLMTCFKPDSSSQRSPESTQHVWKNSLKASLWSAGSERTSKVGWRHENLQVLKFFKPLSEKVTITEAVTTTALGSVNFPAMGDVKVYVELASISAGENDAEIDQVACFHDAAMGYGPLLYSLSPQAGFQEFMKCAKQVWDAQSRDEKLPDKLVIISFFF